MFLSTSFSKDISQKWFVDIIAIFIFLQDASTILTINEATDSKYVSQSYCRICDDTIFHYFAFANDLAFIYLWKHNNNTLL